MSRRVDLPDPSVVRAALEDILPLRAQYLAQARYQVRYDACHERGWTDSYLIASAGAPIGYAALKGEERDAHRDTIFEFHLSPPFQPSASRVFSRVLAASGATRIEAQTNDALLTAVLFEFGRDLNSDVMLFQHRAPAHHAVPGATFRRRRADDELLAHAGEPLGEYVVEIDGRVVASGGFLLHYNPPFADVYMEVESGYRRRGIGSFLVQEIAAACYQSGRIPAARCSIDNVASRATLEAAGFEVCAFLVAGAVRDAAADA